ncbi:MAG: PfkB family carbohydrate kinase [Kiritimatiellaeota bacterium]|nr:PfkB family carbohydrate kinase [Kiritimatiellota bacterium]
MSSPKNIPLVVVGSIGLDTIATPRERRTDLLGGSASYAGVAAAFFTRVGLVGVVGSDFDAAHLALYRRCGCDLAGLQIRDGRTFRWSGVYEENMDNRRTLSTELNVFADFAPCLPPAYRRAPFLFLANIAPALQLHVLDQMRPPRFVMADTMDLWIETARPALQRVIRRVHLLTVNESEARHLTGQRSLLAAAHRLLGWGPRYVLIKKGEHGCSLFSRRGVFQLPAYPVPDVRDPTGAGDTFAGGFIGALAAGGRVHAAALRRAMLYGSVVASFGVEAFSLDRLRRLTRRAIGQRARVFHRMLRVD